MKKYRVGVLLLVCTLVAGMRHAVATQYLVLTAAAALAFLLSLRRQYFELLVLLLVVEIIGFDVTILKGFPRLRIEDFIGFTAVPFALVFQRPYKWQGYGGNRLTLLLLLLGSMTLVSTLYAYSAGLSVFHIRDFTVVFIFLKLAMLSMLVDRIYLSPERVITLCEVICLCFGLACLLAIVEAAGIQSAIEFGAEYFTPEGHLGALGLMGRQTGTAPNPNVFGAMVLLGLCLLLSYVKNYKIGFLYSLGALSLFGVALLATGSRSSVTGALAVASLFFLIGAPELSSRRLIFYAMVFLPVAYVLYRYFYISSYMGDYWSLLQDPFSSGSFRARWESGFSMSLGFFDESPLLGMGAAKGSVRGMSDSEYYYVLSRYGVTGLLCLFALYGNVLLSSYHTLKARDTLTRERATIGLAFLLMGVAALVVNVANSVLFGQLILSNLFVTLLSVLFAFRKQQVLRMHRATRNGRARVVRAGRLGSVLERRGIC